MGIKINDVNALRYNQRNDVPFNSLLGLTLTAVEASDDAILFTSGERQFAMYHDEECCENVYIESIVGDLQDLVDHPITLAEEVDNDAAPLREDEKSFTWTFYKLATIKGYVDIRWYGSSNGYYSESVSFSEVVEQ